MIEVKISEEQSFCISQSYLDFVLLEYKHPTWELVVEVGGSKINTSYSSISKALDVYNSLSFNPDSLCYEISELETKVKFSVISLCGFFRCDNELILYIDDKTILVQCADIEKEYARIKKEFKDN